MTFRFLHLYTFLLLSVGFAVGIGKRSAHAEDISALERQVHELVNQHRTAIGLEPLLYSEEVAAVARQHSRNMAKGFVGHGHEGAEERGRSLSSIIPYSEFGENVGGNTHNAASTAQAAVTGWLNSPGHRANIEGQFDTTGIGVARGSSTFFFTQIFLRTRQTPQSPSDIRRPRERMPERSYSPEDERDEPPSRDRRAYIPLSPEEERDPRQRPGRRRVRGGYLQNLDEGH